MKSLFLFVLVFLCTAGCLAQDFNLLSQSLTTLTESFGALQEYLIKVKKVEIPTTTESIEVLQQRLKNKQNALNLENDPKKQEKLKNEIFILEEQIKILQR